MSPTQDQTALQGRFPVATGNVAVTMLKEGRLWRVRVSVFGEADSIGHRLGLSCTLSPEKFASAKALTDAVGRAAATEARLLAKQERTDRKHGKRARPCIDETDAYGGAVKMFQELVLQLRAEGKA